MAGIDWGVQDHVKRAAQKSLKFFGGLGGSYRRLCTQKGALYAFVYAAEVAIA